jgi:hypothetical protein
MIIGFNLDIIIVINQCNLIVQHVKSVLVKYVIYIV